MQLLEVKATKYIFCSIANDLGRWFREVLFQQLFIMVAILLLLLLDLQLFDNNKLIG